LAVLREGFSAGSLTFSAAAAPGAVNF